MTDAEKYKHLTRKFETMKKKLDAALERNEELLWENKELQRKLDLLQDTIAITNQQLHAAASKRSWGGPLQ